MLLVVNLVFDGLLEPKNLNGSLVVSGVQGGLLAWPWWWSLLLRWRAAPASLSSLSLALFAWRCRWWFRAGLMRLQCRLGLRKGYGRATAWS